MASYPDQLNPGAFIATTQPVDPYTVNDLSVDDDLKQLLINVGTALNDISLLLNVKTTGYYPLIEFLNSNLYFPDPNLSSSSGQTPLYRNTFQMVVNFGTLPNMGTTSVAHGIAVMSGYTFTHMYGAASIPGSNFVAIPNSDIKLTADATNVTITTTSAYVGYTHTYIVLEYIKF